MIPTLRVPRAGLIRAQEKGIHDRSPSPCSRLSFSGDPVLDIRRHLT
jgi:hypothetical protein